MNREGGGGGGGFPREFFYGEPVPPRSNPSPFCKPFLTDKVSIPSIEKSVVL